MYPEFMPTTDQMVEEEQAPSSSYDEKKRKSLLKGGNSLSSLLKGGNSFRRLSLSSKNIFHTHTPKFVTPSKTSEEPTNTEESSQPKIDQLDAEEKSVAIKYLKRLQAGGSYQQHVLSMKWEGAQDNAEEEESNVFLADLKDTRNPFSFKEEYFPNPLKRFEKRFRWKTKVDSSDNADLGNGLGYVVPTKDGGYLAMVPKLAMYLSKPFVLPYLDDASGFSVFQMMASVGTEQLSSDILSLVSNTELNGRTAQQIAYEGIASAVIRGRNKEDSHSSRLARLARTVQTAKTMATVMNALRKKWMSSDIRYVPEEPYTMDEMLAFSMQAIEGMAVEILQIQAGLAEKEAHYPVCPYVWNDLANTKGPIERNRPLAAAFPLEKWLELSTATINNDATLMVSAVAQFRDPMKQYEEVGGPLVVLIQTIPTTRATHADGDDLMYKLNALYVGGLNLFNGGIWNAEKQHLTAKQWLVAHGLGKAGKVCKPVQEKADEVLWTMVSCAVQYDLPKPIWLKPLRLPDVKLDKEGIEALRLTQPFG